MTNEEKAREIVSVFENMGEVSFTYEELIPILLRIANWKDQQFKEYLEKKLAETHPYWNGYECFGAENIIIEIINELFPKESHIDNSDNDE